MEILNYIKELFFTNIKLGSYTLSINLLDLFLKLVLPVIAVFILYKLIKKGLEKFIYGSKLTNSGKDNFYKWIRFVLRAIVLVVVLLFIVNLLGAQITLYLSAFGSVLTKPFIQGISITTLLLIIPILYLSQIGGKFSQKFTSRSIDTYFKFDVGTQQTVTAVVKNITIALIILFGLTVIGIDLTLLIGLFGIIGIGIGFGLQGLVGNLFSGVVILTTKPVKVGDHIIVDGTEGVIVEVRLLQSIVSTITHESIIIPNSQLIDNPVHNYSFDDSSIIINNSIQVSYDSDLDRVLKILESVAAVSPYILDDKPIKSRVVSFDDSGITLSLISWIKNSSDKYDAKSYINLEIWRAFRENEIDIPFPQVDITVK